MMAIRSKGSYVVKRQRPRYRTTAEARQIIVPFVGPFDALKSAEPAIDSTISGFPSDHKVKEVSIEEGRANDGRMTVTLEKPQPGATNSSSDSQQIGETIYELDWGEERLPLESHKKCPALKPDRKAWLFPDRADGGDNLSAPWPVPLIFTDPGAYSQRTWDHWQSLTGEDITGGTWSITQYKDLKERGFDDYPHVFPIARVTTYAKFRIAPNGSVASASSPPGNCGAPGGWTYIKTASRSTKQGRVYSLIEEWRGYPYYPADLTNS